MKRAFTEPMLDVTRFDIEDLLTNSGIELPDVDLSGSGNSGDAP